MKNKESGQRRSPLHLRISMRDNRAPRGSAGGHALSLQTLPGGTAPRRPASFTSSIPNGFGDLFRVRLHGGTQASCSLHHRKPSDDEPGLPSRNPTSTAMGRALRIRSEEAIGRSMTSLPVRRATKPVIAGNASRVWQQYDTGAGFDHASWNNAMKNVTQVTRGRITDNGQPTTDD